MEFYFDLTPIYLLGTQGPLVAFAYFFTHGGWVFFLIMTVYFSYIIWWQAKQNKWFDSNKFTLLAIDIPKDTEQTPKAVEQLFATISGAHAVLNAKEVYLFGMFQLAFSFEIISIDGYIQFLIRTPSHWRDLVESSIYSQYPDAEITEVEDYIDTVPDEYPNDTHNIWGTEIIPARSWVYPIRTYPYFEDPSAEEKFKDPIASLLETMSKVQRGEQVWFQIIVRPTGFDWIKRSMDEAMKLAGKKKATKESFLSRIFNDIFGLFFLSTGETWFWPTGGTAVPTKKSDKKDDMPSLMLHLTPGEKGAIEAIENKASKIGFDCKMRLIYISPLEQYSVPRVISSVFGSLKQFNTLDLNAFKPDNRTKTKINYFFIQSRTNERRKRIISAYKGRSTVMGHSTFILNTEELASIWHFPSKYIKAPLLSRTENKKAEPPTSLPMDNNMSDDKAALSENLRNQLYYTGFGVNLSDKHFEERFAKKNNNTVEPAKKKSEPPANLPIE
ncbi:hypothetical protein C4566_01320 [Candidatus Parcubacteria bacterium]|nr:MAG: hypothetical protein C4566_01320 [Candidatus Parcubacteria bacterium]